MQLDNVSHGLIRLTQQQFKVLKIKIKIKLLIYFIILANIHFYRSIALPIIIITLLGLIVIKDNLW